MDQAKNVYQSRLENFQTEAKKWEQKCNQLGIARLLFFCLSAVGIFYLFKTIGPQAFWIALLIFAIFLALVKWSDRLKEKRDYYQNLCRVNEEELLALDHDFSCFSNGEDFADSLHPYSSDVDIFGEQSVFQFLCRASTSVGRASLAEYLNSPAEKEVILIRQEAVKTLQPDIDWRQDYQSKGLGMEDSLRDISDLKKWINNAPFITPSKFLQVVIRLLPLAMLASLIAYAMGWTSGFIPAVVYLANLAIIKFTQADVDAVVNGITPKLVVLKKYKDLIEQIENYPSNKSVLLDELKRRLETEGHSAGKQLERLNQLAANLNVRTNLIGYILFNTFFLWELIFCEKLEKWKASVSSDFENWFTVIGEYEALSSLATCAFNQSDWVFPEIVDEYCAYEATDLGHFLLSPEGRINNSFSLLGKAKIHLVTGSNMSGKTTFLRTLGVNLVLALAGAPACATSLSCSVMMLHTNMRNIDSLQESTSSFYAELKGIKRTIDAARLKEPPIFYLLDEILKGTNSDDRHDGSVALIKQLLAYGSSGLISTHDLALCSLGDTFGGNVENWCFEVQIENGEMHFDYKLKQGVCKSRNASLLMQQMGIEM